jgi:hypothetical protein
MHKDAPLSVRPWKLSAHMTPYLRASLEIFGAQERRIFHRFLEILRAQKLTICRAPLEIVRAQVRTYSVRPWIKCMHRDAVICIHS